MIIVPLRQSRLYTTHCKNHTLKFDDANSFEMNRDPYCGDAYVSIHRGRIGICPVQIKVWRGAPMNHERRVEFVTHLTKELDDWKRAFHHKNISPFIGLMDGPIWEHLPSLVTPLYPNGNITQYLTKHPKTNLLYMLHSIADALVYMHSLSPPVVHGGLRGANILVADNGEPHLTDLCISFLPHAQGLAVAGDELDHARWLAPEVLEPPVELQSQHNATTPESDVFAFGMLMFELCTGGKPWPNKRRNASVICAVVDGHRPSRPKATNEWMTDHIWALIQLCWAHDPRDRPTMKYVQTTLQSLWLKDVGKDRLVASL